MGRKEKKSKKDKKGAIASVAESGPSLENGGSEDFLVHRRYRNNGGVQIVEEEEKNLSRSLSQRHIQMIALAGAIVRPFFPHVMPADNRRAQVSSSVSAERSRLVVLLELF
jgi:amino acid permease